MDLTIQHDTRHRKFFVELEHGEAQLQYRPRGERTSDFVSTFVPPPHRGRGIGEAIVTHALAHARAHGWEVVPTCPFVARVIERHPEYGDLVRVV